MFGGAGARLRLRFAFEMDVFLFFFGAGRNKHQYEIKARKKGLYGVIMGLVLTLLHGVEKFWVFFFLQ